MEKKREETGRRDHRDRRGVRKPWRRNWRYITRGECPNCRYEGTGVIFYSKGEVLFRCKFCASKVYHQVAEEEKSRWIEGKHPQGSHF
jgi:hypothetical protein